MQSITEDRAAQLLMSAQKDLSYDSARARLEGAALRISIDTAVGTPWGQSALLSMVASGTKMFLGGVHAEVAEHPRCILPQYANRTVQQVLVDMGARGTLAPESAFHVHIGADAATTPKLFCIADGWRGAATCSRPSVSKRGNELSGALAGALAVTSAFRGAVLQDLLATRKPQIIDLWPGAEREAIDYLPASIWLIGLGNLGQALLFVLGLLPIANTSKVSLLLQDSDVAGRENLSVQILTKHDWIGRSKASCSADWSRARGFKVIATERRFYPGDGPRNDEPRIALVGVDNLDARRAAASAGFDLVIDAGLGGSGAEAFDIRLHAFPGSRTPQAAWPEQPERPASGIPENLAALVDAGRLDKCGAMQIAGQSVGVPSTALAAATLQLTQLIRALAGKRYCDLIDVSLRDTVRFSRHEAMAAIAGLPFERSVDAL